jgi:hypothetical protein
LSLYETPDVIVIQTSKKVANVPVLGTIHQRHQGSRLASHLEEFRVDRVESIPGATVGILDSGARTAIVPVVAANDDSLMSEVVAGEAKVVGAERAVTAHDLTEVLDDVAIIANLVVGMAAQVTAEAVEARVPLLEDNGLSFDLADLLSDDPLGHLLQDNQALLDDFNALSMADKFMLLLDNDLAEVRAIEVINTIEVVEVVQGSMATPVVERREATNGQFIVGPEGDWSSGDIRSQGGEGNGGELSKHGVSFEREGFRCLKQRCKADPREEGRTKKKKTVEGNLAKQG